MYQEIIAWYKKNKRDLPWRKTSDPYCILVSELMLQQTQVARGLLFYERWLIQFPDWTTLACAKKEDILAAWSGLGYNRRALVLQDIAKYVVKQGLPQTPEQWQQLKGIGAYTASAVSLFSGQESQVYPVDTNIRRVVGRFLGKCYPDLKEDDQIIRALQSLLKGKRNRADFFQALFDFANAVCLKAPLCLSCPLKEKCQSSKVFLSGAVKPRVLVKKVFEKKHRNKKYPDRIYRGRILKVVQEKKRTILELGFLIDETYEEALDLSWVTQMVSRMKKDGLIQEKDTFLFI